MGVNLWALNSRLLLACHVCACGVGRSAGPETPASLRTVHFTGRATSIMRLQPQSREAQAHPAPAVRNVGPRGPH